MRAPLNFDDFPPASFDDWRAAAEVFLKGASFEKKLITRTLEGIAIPAISFPNDTADLPESWPGLAPFTRGNQPLTPRIPIIAQEIPAGNVKVFNRLLREDLTTGQNATPIRLDSATRGGSDADECDSEKDNRWGLSVPTLDDLSTALEEIDLGAAPLFVWTGPSSLPFLALLGALIKKQTYATQYWSGALLADPLTEWARDGQLSLSLSDSYDEMAGTFQWAELHLPRYRLVGVQANLWADAGGSAVQELAYALATGAEYMRALGQRDVVIDVAAPRMQFGLSLGSQVFMQIAKIRAARRLWTHVIEAFGGDSALAPLAIHGRTGTFNKCSLDPYTNLLRTTGEAFVGLVGQVDSMNVSAFDEPCRVPDAFSRHLARNIPIILAEECGLLDVADPAGGSWSIERLTDDMAHAAWAEFQKIESLGGMAEALRQGVPQSAVAQQRAARSQALANGKELLVGVNLSANPVELPLPSAERDPEVARSLPSRPPIVPLSEEIRDVNSAIEAYLNGASIGQVRSALPRSSETEIKIDPVREENLADEFQSLRASAAGWRQATGQFPGAWLATFGPPRQHRARADFSSGFLACGGFEIHSGESTSDVARAATAAIDSDCPVVVICSTDETYPEIIPAFAGAVKSVRPHVLLVLAGSPGEHEAAYRAAGIDEFIHLRANRVTVLKNLLQKLEPKISRS